MQHDVVEIPGSNMKEAIAKVLKVEGYVSDYEIEELDGGHETLKVSLKYNQDEEVLKGLERVSKPSKRVYVSKAEIPQVLGGLGTSVLSTSQGIMTGKQAREEGIGGELLLKVW